MKSIGFFWTNSEDENECCRKCLHLKDDTAQSNSASKEQTCDEFEFQMSNYQKRVLISRISQDK